MKAQFLAPLRATTLQALGAAFIESLYLRLLLPHNLAAELSSSQIASAYAAGTWPPNDWAERSLAQGRDDFVILNRAIRKSAIIALSGAALILLLAAATGKIHPSLPWDWGKVVSSIGAGLIAWATALQFNPPRPSFRSTLLHEVAHAVLVRKLVIGGSVLAALGTLWWQ